MSKGNYNFECPFYEYKNIDCSERMYYKETHCPEQIRNKCVNDIALTKEDEQIIKETWNKVKEKNKVEIEAYKIKHPLYYPIVPSLQTKCPIDYNWCKCSSKEYDLECRTCANYNPLRMLYEEAANGVKICVPKEVLLSDCKIQLEKG